MAEQAPQSSAENTEISSYASHEYARVTLAKLKSTIEDDLKLKTSLEHLEAALHQQFHPLFRLPNAASEELLKAQNELKIVIGTLTVKTEDMFEDQSEAKKKVVMEMIPTIQKKLVKFEHESATTAGKELQSIIDSEDYKGAREKFLDIFDIQGGDKAF